MQLAELLTQVFVSDRVLAIAVFGAMCWPIYFALSWLGRRVTGFLLGVYAWRVVAAADQCLERAQVMLSQAGRVEAGFVHSVENMEEKVAIVRARVWSYRYYVSTLVSSRWLDSLGMLQLKLL